MLTPADSQHLPEDVPRLDRVLVIAPHPDDEVIGAGGLIQRAIATGGRIRIVLLTAGEKNAWPQRVMLKKWRITAADRSGWARLRVREAEEGLARLGAAADCMELLGYPDQRLASVARLHCDRIIAELETRVSDFDPTLVVVPSSFDIHADHRAAAFFAHRAVADPSRIVTYVVHGKAPAERTHFTLHLLESERRRKREAIEVHTTQLLLGRERYLSYARTTETFYRSEEDLVRVDTASRELVDTMRHAAHAVRRSIAARLSRRSDR